MKMNFKEQANLVCILRITKFMKMFVITKDSNSKKSVKLSDFIKIRKIKIDLDKSLKESR